MASGCANARRAEGAAASAVAAGVSAATGETFFQQLVLQLGKLFDARHAYIGLLDEVDPAKVKTLAVSTDGAIGDNFVYRLDDTPCATVAGQSTCAYPDHVQQHFPKDALLREMNAVSYIGTPLFDLFADAEARARADSLLQCLRAGEDFARLVARTTDDPATRDNGGDLGLFARGTMLPEVERAAFAMRPGDLSQAPVKSPVGYHILLAREYVLMAAQPLEKIYVNVGARAASERADSLTKLRADSLLRSLPDARAARAAAQRLGLLTVAYAHERGERGDYPAELHAYVQQIENLKPGQVLRTTRNIGNMGYAVTWVDSIGPALPPTWENSRERALATYRAEAGQRATQAKRAELDSLLASGWAFDSLAAGLGGLKRAREFTPGARLPGIAAEDIGPCAFGIFARGETLAGKSVGIAGEQLTGAQMAEQLTLALGEPVRHVAPSPREYAALGFPGADDLANMFQFKADFERAYCAARNPACARELHPGLQSFAGWLARHGSRIPLQ